MVRCEHCGVFLGEKRDKRRKYCVICAPLVDHEKALVRCKRFRVKHREELRVSYKNWCKEHPEQRRLHARNWVYRHREKHLRCLYEWRKRNPELVREQNHRAKKRLKTRRIHRLYSQGVRPERKGGVGSFISICKTCGREIVNNGRGYPRKYCDGCYPQIMALRRVFRQERYNRNHPDGWHTWNQNNKEVVVAMTCRVCGNFIVYKGKGKYPQKCGLCKCIERSRPRPTWNPKDTKLFIQRERYRLGLYKNKRWTKRELQYLDERNWGREPIAVADDD